MFKKNVLVKIGVIAPIALAVISCRPKGQALQSTVSGTKHMGFYCFKTKTIPGDDKIRLRSKLNADGGSESLVPAGTIFFGKDEFLGEYRKVSIEYSKLNNSYFQKPRYLYGKFETLDKSKTKDYVHGYIYKPMLERIDCDGSLATTGISTKKQDDIIAANESAKEVFYGKEAKEGFLHDGYRIRCGGADGKYVYEVLGIARNHKYLDRTFFGVLPWDHATVKRNLNPIVIITEKGNDWNGGDDYEGSIGYISKPKHKGLIFKNAQLKTDGRNGLGAKMEWDGETSDPINGYTHKIRDLKFDLGFRKNYWKVNFKHEFDVKENGVQIEKAKTIDMTCKGQKGSQ